MKLFMLMKMIRLILSFYKSFAFASLAISLSCVIIINKWGGDTFIALLWYKIITMGLIFYYIQTNKSDNFFYYKNLGLTKKLLWITTLSLDFILFLLITVTAIKTR